MKIAKQLLALGSAALILAACSDADDLTALEPAAEGSSVLESVLSVDYDVQNDIYVAVGQSPEGDIDVYTGEHKNWTKLQENRDIDNRYSAGQFVDFAIGDGDAMYGVAVGNIADFQIGFRQTAPRCTSINAREFFDKPYFGDGQPEAIGNMEQCFSVDYDVQNNIYVVVGVTGGQIDVYTGQNGNWTQLQENRDIDNRYTPAEFVDFAIGDGDAMYGVAVGNNQDGAGNADVGCTSINARETSNKPYFGDGAPTAIGDMETCLSIDYDAQNDIYVVVGVTGGQIDVYTGEHKNWTKLQENRDIDNRYSPNQFVDFAIGDGDAMYGVAVGNIADYRIGFRQNAPRGTSINAREFYNKPYFGDGRPEVIGE